MPNILVFDIETAPNLAYVWQFFKAMISPKQVVQNSQIMCFAATWLESGVVIYHANEKGTMAGEKALIKKLIALLDKADIVIAHNGRKFDMGKVRGRALVHGLKPPSPVKVIDTLLSARKEFNFEANSLEHLANVLGCEPKDNHKDFPGWELWIECINKNPKAWKEMKHYNIQDIETLEEIYLKMRPWITNHPNLGVYTEDVEAQCPKCNSTHIHYRGYTTTAVSMFRKFQCQSCGGWGRARVNVLEKDKRQGLVTNAI